MINKARMKYMGLLNLFKNNIPITEYIIFDFETTGLNPRTDRVIEIAAMKVRNKQIIDTFESFVNPKKNITKIITEINGITNEMVMDAPTEEAIFPLFANYINNQTITAYNVNFDISFLDSALKRIGVAINVDYFDSLKIARNIFSGVPNYKLETIMRTLIPNYIQRHRALQDCYAVKNILDRTIVMPNMLE